LGVVSHNSGTTLNISLNYQWRVVLTGLIDILTTEGIWDISEENALLMSQFAFDLLSDLYD
jgi:hypothetical protein